MPTNTWGTNQNLNKGDVLQTQNSTRTGTTRNIEVTVDDVLSKNEVLRGLQIIGQRINESTIFPKP
jgi:hypothetical protein